MVVSSVARVCVFDSVIVVGPEPRGQELAEGSMFTALFECASPKLINNKRDI